MIFLFSFILKNRMKCFIVLLIFAFFFVSCSPLSSKRKGDATAILQEILSVFPGKEGAIYSDREEAEYPLTDALIARMFPDMGDLDDFSYVVSRAAWFSRRFSDREILILEICDLSHQKDLLRLLEKRKKKKENAVVFADGIYLYLICTDQNEEIIRYLQS